MQRSRKNRVVALASSLAVLAGLGALRSIPGSPEAPLAPAETAARGRSENSEISPVVVARVAPVATLGQRPTEPVSWSLHAAPGESFRYRVVAAWQTRMGEQASTAAASGLRWEVDNHMPDAFTTRLRAHLDVVILTHEGGEYV